VTRARGSFESFVGNCGGENFFVSLVEGGSGDAGIVHGHCSNSRGRVTGNKTTPGM
jgi:hypothetical protein